MAVGGVEHEHVGPRLGECARLCGGIAVDADRHRDGEAALRVKRRAIQRAAQRAARSARTDEAIAVDDTDHLYVVLLLRGEYAVEGRALPAELVNVDRAKLSVNQVSQQRVTRCRREASRGQDPMDLITAQAGGTDDRTRERGRILDICNDHPVALGRWHEPKCVGDRCVGRQQQRSIAGCGLLFDLSLIHI